jgi:hypothetical protein
MAAAINIDAIVTQMISEATKIGGNTWTAIQKSAPLYFKGYAQALADIAVGVTTGDISKDDAKMYTKNAYLLLIQGITNTAHVMLFSVQQLIDSLLNVVRASINTALPVKLL